MTGIIAAFALADFFVSVLLPVVGIAAYCFGIGALIHLCQRRD